MKLAYVVTYKVRNNPVVFETKISAHFQSIFSCCDLDHNDSKNISKVTAAKNRLKMC
jgi:hypothetical protein